MTNPQPTLYLMVKTKNLPSKIKNKARLPLSPLLFNITLEVLASTIRQKKGIKRLSNRKQRIQTLTICDDMILYIERPKDSTRTLLQTISKYSNASGYEINIAFLYSNKKSSEKEVEIIPFASATKRIKYLGTNLTKHVEDLYNENYKTLLK
uniref:Reverse transcriptase domain-containing protein n=1 Tax=Rousettus aegyptiacus TaxID=9407 RepID=A0A7J8H1X8_ROUAE|nr:hypothetical protein HJG63_011302 [Rousettus aegyptiacus]